MSFAKPQEVTLKADQKKVTFDEMIISFPTNTGGIWVRSGTDYMYLDTGEFSFLR